jgi:hypothetical protein
MPFTVSHAAAVLPLRRLNLVWSAVTIGSMTPDFPYILGSENRSLGHDFPGLIWFTIPVSLIALWLFHNVIKRPVIGLLPLGMQQRLRDQAGSFRFGGVSRFFAILGSVIVGIATHLMWDSFTHSETLPWRHIAWLREWKRVPGIGVVPACTILQYASSIGGILALAIWIAIWYRDTAHLADARPPHVAKSRFALALAIFIVAGLAGILRAVLTVGTPITIYNVDPFLMRFAVTSIALAFWQLLLYCVLMSSYQVW